MRYDHGSSLYDLSVILGCCKKTVWNLLCLKKRPAVNRRYSDNLTRYLGLAGRPPWDPTGGCGYGMADILREWRSNEGPSHRRRVANRLSVFVTELVAGTFKMSSAAELLVSSSGEPARLRITIMSPTSAPSTLLMFFDPSNRDKLDIKFTNPKGHQSFSGAMQVRTISQLLDRVYTNGTSKNSDKKRIVRTA